MINNEQLDSLVQAIRNRPLASLRKAALAVLAKPPLIDIEVSSACNTTCVFCPRNVMQRRFKIMPPKIFTRILTILPTNANVMFAGLGEPLLNKQIVNYVDSLSNHNISCCIITNGILLTPKKQKQLIAAGVQQLQISYSSIDKKILKFITNNEKHNDIVDMNLKYLADNRPPNLRVQLNFTLINENKNELQRVNNFARSLGFNIYVRRGHSRGGYYCTNNYNKNINSNCGIFAAVTFISSDGKVLACSNDLTEKLFFKYIIDTNWQEIMAWKKQFILQNFPYSPCANCNDDYRWLILDHLSVDRCTRYEYLS